VADAALLAARSDPRRPAGCCKENLRPAALGRSCSGRLGEGERPANYGPNPPRLGGRSTLKPVIRLDRDSHGCRARVGMPLDPEACPIFFQFESSVDLAHLDRINADAYDLLSMGYFLHRLSADFRRFSLGESVRIARRHVLIFDYGCDRG